MAEHVKQAIEGMLNSWGNREATGLCNFVGQCVKKMKKAMDDMGVPSMGCVAHTLQLVVHEGLLSQCSLVNARKIIGHFKHSPSAYSHLADIQIDLKMEVKRRQQDVQVRWNSIYALPKNRINQIK